MSRQLTYAFWAVHGLVLAIALLDGANNAASFVSIALGSRVLRIERLLVYAFLGELIGTTVLAPEIYTRLLPLTAYAVHSPASISIALAAATAWIALATKLKVISPISVVLLGILAGTAVSNPFTYLKFFGTYLCIWVAQIAMSSAITVLVIRGSRRLAKISDALTVLLPLTTLAYVFANALKLKNATLAAVAIVVALLGIALVSVLRLPQVSAISVAIPLTSAAVAHGTNDAALMLAILSLANAYESCVPPRFSSAVLGLAISLGIVLWARRISEALARGVVLLDLATAKNIYTSVFITTALLITLGMPTPMTFSVLGSFIGVGIGKGFSVVAVKTALKLVATAFATVLAISVCVALTSLIPVP